MLPAYPPTSLGACSHEAASKVSLPHAIVRSASNINSGTVMRDPTADDVWLAGPQTPADLSAGYSFAIGTSSTAVLSMLQGRCLKSNAAANCAFVV